MVEKQLFLCNEIFKKWLKKAFFGIKYRKLFFYATPLLAKNVKKFMFAKILNVFSAAFMKIIYIS